MKAKVFKISKLLAFVILVCLVGCSKAGDRLVDTTWETYVHGSYDWQVRLTFSKTEVVLYSLSDRGSASNNSYGVGKYKWSGTDTIVFENFIVENSEYEKAIIVGNSLALYKKGEDTPSGVYFRI